MRSLALLFGVLAAWAGGADQNRPTTIVTRCHRLAQHATHQRTAAPAAAGTGADAGAFADLFKGSSAGLNCFGDAASANFITDAGGFEVVDDRLLPGFLFLLVDGGTPCLYGLMGRSLPHIFAKLTSGKR